MNYRQLDRETVRKTNMKSLCCAKDRSFISELEEGLQHLATLVKQVKIRNDDTQY